MHVLTNFKCPAAPSGHPIQIAMAGIYSLALIGNKGFDVGWLHERLLANDTEVVLETGAVVSGRIARTGTLENLRGPSGL
jgi:hypothetical protein